MRQRHALPTLRLLMLIAIAPGTTFGATSPVDPAATAEDVLVVDSTGGGDHTRIQDAILASMDGDVILVRAGHYAEDVTIDGRGVTVVADGATMIEGRFQVRSIPLDREVLVAGFEIFTPDLSVGGVGGGHVGTVTVTGANGPVRFVDCEIRGRAVQSSNATTGSVRGDAGDHALEASTCRDVALVDCQLEGGHGSITAVNDAGHGGFGLVANAVERLSLIRSVFRGGGGGTALFAGGGDGGSGASVEGTSRAYVAYSGFFGGGGGDGDWNGTDYGDGGDGIFIGAPVVLWDFEGVYAAGQGHGTSLGSPDGLDVAGSGTRRVLDGFPNTLHAPLLVREGETYNLQSVGEPGEIVHAFVASRTGFGFRPRTEQPRLLASPPLGGIVPLGVIPGTERLDWTRAAGDLPAGVDASVLWVQVTMRPVNGRAAWASPRPIIFLDGSF